MGTIVFVHGTGVRLKDYSRSFAVAEKTAKECKITDGLVECAWGDALGVDFKGDSLPEELPEDARDEDAEDFAQWNWLFDDPLFELDKLTIPAPGSDRRSPPPPGVKEEWEELWDKIRAYRPSDHLKELLTRGDVEEYWPGAWDTIIREPLTRDAFQASAHELADVSRALARAVVAQLHVMALSDRGPGLGRELREKLLERLIRDWGQEVYGFTDWAVRQAKRAVTAVMRRNRYRASNSAAFIVGDILLYQSRGEEIRAFIRKIVEKAAPPVTIFAHSLGGIACVELLALPSPPKVARLVTVGSQAPLFYEMGALGSLKRPEPLPEGFPNWLNVYDRNDFLSYVARRFWRGVVDAEVKSNQPFPDSHSAYFASEAVWKLVADFMKK